MLREYLASHITYAQQQGTPADSLNPCKCAARVCCSETKRDTRMGKLIHDTYISPSIGRDKLKSSLFKHTI
jgi:hypothetical protein